MDRTVSRPTGSRQGRYDRESLLAVAVAEFTQRGFDRTSMEDLARAAGITKSSFYHHVAGKEQLLALALDRALDALFAVLDERGAVQGPAVGRLEHVVRRTVAVLVAELPHVTLLLRVRGNTVTERRALARRRDFDARVTALVAAAQTDGDLGQMEPALVTRLLFGLINSVTEWYQPGRGLSADVLADEVVGLAFDGLRR